ncbi:DUF1131 family protein [Stappia sp. TSB10GB4]|uniref:DUF1131 family protein n=1 Tax=Stappia sp. TSB10GB4 TaxID=2003584 RepID=UPI00164466B8|nr:DUF1131 family protein [Stappia sp. TSB10GB4]
MKLPYPALCLLLPLLAACSPSADLDTVSSVRTQPGPQVRITEAGAGGINAGTPYSAKAIAAALPGFTTEGFQAATEDNTEWAIGAYNAQGFQVLHFYKGSDGKLREMHGVTHHLQGPNGERIGMSFAEIGTARSDCRVGRNLWRGMAICKARGASNITLVYAIPQYPGPFDQLAPGDQLREAVLQRIIWTPLGRT